MRYARSLWSSRERLVDHAKGTADLGEGGDGVLDVLRRVAGGQLHADAGGALRDHGVGEADDVDAFVEHFGGELRGEAGVAEHDRDDRVDAPA